MNVKDFVNGFSNHPIVFVGTGMSLRYLEESYSWEALLQKISFDLFNNDEHYLDLKSKYMRDGLCDFSEIAKDLEIEFNEVCSKNRHGKFKEVNDYFYSQMRNGISISRFKKYICELLNNLELKSEYEDELNELKKTRKNVGSVITTNYDLLIEKIFNFIPLVGNDILLSNPYGSIYKIHGCIKQPNKIIITSRDYNEFFTKYELIRAQLLSMFIHHPIVFLGYEINDENIKSILKTIFSYVEPSTELAKKIRNSFLLVEYEPKSTNTEVYEYDIEMEGYPIIKINKLKTDDYLPLYKALSNLNLPISAMDIRKVQNIVKEIYAGGNIEVSITEDIEKLENKDKVLAIGSNKTIQYLYDTTSELMENYFDIIEEANYQRLVLIDKHTISTANYFPIYGFISVNPDIKSADKLRQIQEKKIQTTLKSCSERCKKKHKKISDIIEDGKITSSDKIKAIFWSCYNGYIDLEDFKNYLISYEDKKSTDYRKLLVLYDFKKYN